MTFPGSHPQYYLQRGSFPNLTPSQVASGLHAPPPPPHPGFRPMSNPNIHHPQASNPGPPPFSMAEHSDFGHSIHMGMGSSASAAEFQPPLSQPPPPPSPPAGTPPARKKRGRPRKYAPAPDGPVSLGLSSMPCVSSNKSKDSSPMSDDPNAPRRARARGRPPGTGRKQRLANLGEWMNTSAGYAFGPHVISVEAGEDIVAKIVSFSQQRPRVLCIMSGTGTVSSVTLRQPGSTTPHLSFKGRYDILSLGGSYLVNDEGGSKSRTGGLSVSLSNGEEGLVFGGGISTLIAASLVQVVACSFVYGASAKSYNTNNNKTIRQEKEPNEEHNNSDMETTPCSAPEAAASAGQQTPPNFSAAQGMSEWPGSGSGRSLDDSSRNLLTDIDLTRG
ncbi:PREDICTED: AT-hook motif nuclear-localized protein 5-like isoform X2 [Camelina sativa]|nr:PREDICTED: AT-hook motif nuclear-localized protein 5-like isoform X2 [Camelina sativa]XP_010430449.1 PREDICTED: AT-hook motif nuclear-localized protein 5-like isoform X2 [Camelina sativa]XP_010430450.1 PREDICTED: AT-hook motif nuclear-localized protein 5-like isoform X2 [Camelina sativa]